MEILSLRKKIHNELTTKGISPFFENLSESQLKTIFQLYNKYFFQGEIQHKLTETNSTLDFEVSGKKRAASGLCYKTGCKYTLSISKRVYLDIFKTKGKLIANGIECYDRLDCLQLTFEHELVHILIYLWNYYKDGDKIFGAHGKLFMCMVKELFGHTAYLHNLNPGTEDVNFLNVSTRYEVGMTIKFLNVTKNISYQGVIHKVNPKKLIVSDVIQLSTGEKLGGFNVPKTVVTEILGTSSVPIVTKKLDESKYLYTSTRSLKSGMKVKFYGSSAKTSTYEGIIRKVNPKRLIVDNVINLVTQQKIPSVNIHPQLIYE